MTDVAQKRGVRGVAALGRAFCVWGLRLEDDWNRGRPVAID